MLCSSRASVVMAAVLAFAGCRASLADGRGLPDYVKKPESWKCYLVGNDLVGITDADLASWLKKAQVDAGQLNPPKEFSIIATFIQCFNIFADRIEWGRTRKRLRLQSGRVGWKLVFSFFTQSTSGGDRTNASGTDGEKFTAGYGIMITYKNVFL